MGGRACSVAVLATTVLTCALPGAARSAGCTPGQVTSTYYNSPVWLEGALLRTPHAPDLLVERFSPAAVSTARFNGATGRPSWPAIRAPRGGGGLLLGDAERTVVEVRDGGGCGSVVVRSIDVTRGRVRWTAPLAGVATSDRPIVDVRTPGLGDVTGDGIDDVPILRTAQDGIVPGLARCDDQPSGGCRVAGASWASRLDVLDGRTGRIVLAKDLGSARAGLPSARLVRRGRATDIALLVPGEGATATATLLRGTRTVWTRQLTSVATDAALVTTAASLTVVSTPTATNGLSLLPTVTGLDPASGAVLWSRSVPGAGGVVALRNGDVVLFDVQTGQMRRVDRRTGLDVWSSLPLGPTRLDPVNVGDVDGRGLDDVAVPLFDRVTVLSGEDAHPLTSLDGMPLVKGSADLTGDGRGDLLVADDSQGETPVVSLVRGGDFSRVWTVPVTMGSERNALRLDATGGRSGSVLVHALYGRRVVLAAATGATRWSLAADV